MKKFGLWSTIYLDLRIDCHESFQMKLSVLISCRNSERFLRETLDSVIAQTEHDLEIIVKDGLSTDDSLAIAKSFSDSRIRIISQADQGLADGLLQAFQASSGNYVTQCCASDGYLDPGWLKSAISYLDNNPDISLVCAFPRYMSEDGTLGDISYKWFHKHLPKPRELTYYWINFGLNLPEGNYVMRREVFERSFSNVHYDSVGHPRADAFLQFVYNFFASGRLAAFLPIVANYGRLHKDSLTQNAVRDSVYTIWLLDYHRQRTSLRNQILKFGRIAHQETSQATNFRFSRFMLFWVLAKWKVIHFFAGDGPGR